MTAATVRGRPVLWSTGTALLTVMALMAVPGCATLPSSSTPQVIDRYAPVDTQSAVPTPVPGQEPDLLIRDFLRASAIAEQRHGAARQFLTPRAGEQWDDSRSTTVVLRADLSSAGERTEDRASYRLRAEKVGSLDPGGIYHEESGPLDMQFDLVKIDGQWRIDALPPGVVLERTEFFSTYAQRYLYFLSGSAGGLVPDPRWTSVRGGDLGYALVNLLATGPRGELAPGVASRVPRSVSVRPTDPDSDQVDGGITIDFQGLPVLSSQATTEFAAQVVWTLNRAGVGGPYRLERGGSPIDERRAQGWTVKDVAEFAPRGQDRPMQYTLTAADGLVTVEAEGVRPAGGAWSALRGGRSAALSRDGATLGVVTGDDRGTRAVLLAGPVSGSGEQVLESRSLTVPTFHPADGALWTVVDGQRLVGVRIGDRRGPDGRPQVREFDPAVLESLRDPVVDLKIDATGSRFALVSGGSVYIGTIRREGHTPVAGSLRRIGGSLQRSARSVAWLDPSTIVVGRDVAEAPVVTLSLDGAQPEPLSQRNVGTPVDTLAASAGQVYAIDNRSLLQLDSSVDTGRGFWREIQGLNAIRAYPVVAG